MTTSEHYLAGHRLVPEQRDRPVTTARFRTTDSRTVEVECAVQGAPEHRLYPLGNIFTPDYVRITYRQIEEVDASGAHLIRASWYAAVHITGPSLGSHAGSIHDVLIANVRGDDPYEHWPTWLRALAEQYHPDRPGGWPGGDPNGSYL